MVGTKCNMNCQYCYESTHDFRYDFDSNLSRTDIFNFFSKIKNLDYISVVFHGGEPLLADKSDVIYTINLVKRLFESRCEFQFQTNGVLINEDWISVFKSINHKLSISISLDPVGNKDMRQLGNKNYRKIIFDNIKKLKDNSINVSIVSVAHKYNCYSSCFTDFIANLIKHEIKFLTINKFRYQSINDDLFISEKKYNKLLMSLSNLWITNNIYKKIQIQPLMSLFSNKPNKICIYLKDINKCSNFITFYKNKVLSCEHIVNDEKKTITNCDRCEIYDWCGAGCLSEEKDSTFCSSRKSFKQYIDGVVNENK